MVWIPGGAFEYHGTGASSWYDGSRFARDGIVCVTINYRVGAEGFLSLGEGNVNRGLLDQIAALAWVRENIAAFGGDPDNVTIFGESAGAMSVGTLLAMPRAEGLFRRAIAQSGAAHHVISASTAQRIGQRLAAQLGVAETREAIADVPIECLLQAQAELKNDLMVHPDPERWDAEVAVSLMPWQPVVDGDLLPARPMDRIAAGAGAEATRPSPLRSRSTPAVRTCPTTSPVMSAWAVPSNQPLQTVYSWRGGMAQALAERVAHKDFDVVHVEHLRGSKYARFIKSKFPSIPVVWDSVDCISHLFQQASGQSSSFFGKFVTRFDLPRTRRAEGDLICSFNHTLVTSSADKDALLALAPKGRQVAPLSVLPNGVDLDYFKPNSDIQREPETLVFSGKMSYHANIAMVKFLVTTIMPQVWAKRPRTKLVVVGKDPTPDIREFGRNPLITITGTVYDIRPYLWGAAASVVPLLYGAGIQNKILEAMATGTPVVTTSRTLSALGAKPAKEILVADTPDDFSAEILRLLENGSVSGEVGDAGLRYVREYHDWNRIASRLANVYGQVV
jgi:glycosyltransferase involved in cell wall biosynthesis